MVTVDTSSAPATTNSEEQNAWIGVIAVVISCLSSGFAGVYFESILKGSTQSLWLRNVQLGIFGSLCAFIGMLLYDGLTIRDVGFNDCTPLVWSVISQQAVGGLILALVIRYADNILKGYATSLSIIVSATHTRRHSVCVYAQPPLSDRLQWHPPSVLVLSVELPSVYQTIRPSGCHKEVRLAKWILL